jgi:hypothetical protein
MSRSRSILQARTIILTVLVACLVLACTTTTGAPTGNRPAPTLAVAQTVAQSPQAGEVSGLIAKARAAQRQGDWRLLRQFEASLTELVGSATISAARTSYHRAMADLAAATARGDSHLRAQYRAELRTLCEPDSLVAAFEPCDADVLVRGN